MGSCYSKQGGSGGTLRVINSNAGMAAGVLLMRGGIFFLAFCWGGIPGAAGPTVMHSHCHEGPESTGCTAWVTRGAGVVFGSPRNNLKKSYARVFFLP